MKAKSGQGIRVTPEQQRAIKIALMDKNLSLKEFANLCNMSSGAVSPALNGKITISEHIRNTVKTVLGINLEKEG